MSSSKESLWSNLTPNSFSLLLLVMSKFPIFYFDSIICTNQQMTVVSINSHYVIIEPFKSNF